MIRNNFLLQPLSVSLALAAFSCNPEVTKISLSSVSGGEDGTSSSFEMTQDSTTYAYRSFEPFVKETVIREKTNPASWQKLLQEFDARAFDRAQSGKSMTYIDGIDVQITVEMGPDKHKLLNATVSEEQNPDAYKFVHDLEMLAQDFAATTKAKAK